MLVDEVAGVGQHNGGQDVLAVGHQRRQPDRLGGDEGRAQRGQQHTGQAQGAGSRRHRQFLRVCTCYRVYRRKRSYRKRKYGSAHEGHHKSRQGREPKVRTANLAGAHGVIIPKNRAAGLTPVVAKTSAGALNYTKIAKVTNLQRDRKSVV